MILRWTAIVCTALASVLLVAACGSDGNKDSGGLSSQEKLLVLQARGDIGEFCSVQEVGEGELFDRGFEAMLTGVRDLARIYKENPNAKVDIPVEKKALTLKQVMDEQIKELRKCGKDGRQQAGVLEAALQQQSSSN
jgi:hypothetical protein